MDKSIMNEQVKRLFQSIETSTDEILQRQAKPYEKTKAVCEYVATAVTAQSKGLMAAMYTELSTKTLEEKIFKNLENRNKFHDLDLRSDIYGKYSFKIDNNLDFETAHNKLIEMGISVTVGGGGTILGTALRRPAVVVSSVIAGLLYPLLQKILSDNSQELKKEVKKYLIEIENEMLAWFDSIESYYNEQIVELKKTL